MKLATCNLDKSQIEGDEGIVISGRFSATFTSLFPPNSSLHLRFQSSVGSSVDDYEVFQGLNGAGVDHPFETGRLLCEEMSLGQPFSAA